MQQFLIWDTRKGQSYQLITGGPSSIIKHLLCSYQHQGRIPQSPGAFLTSVVFYPVTVYGKPELKIAKKLKQKGQGGSTVKYSEITSDIS